MIHPELQELYPMNEEQQKIISHKEGPLRVIAGPGSGKTYSIMLLAMNLLLCGDAKPAQLILCTYTEKAAYEMQDRLASIAKTINYKEDLSQLQIGTIHSLCNHFVEKYLHHTPLGNNYEILSQFTQSLLIFEHLDEICRGRSRSFFEELWGTPWRVAKKLGTFFDKITEELIFDRLKEHLLRTTRSSSEHDMFLYYLSHAYKNYQMLLARTNRVDFAHLQKCAYDLLQKEHVYKHITRDLRYILVDEYQDTNYIQEQILLSLARSTGHNNLFVVGDEDQALYRFRGATVRNILEFAKKGEFNGKCAEHQLTINYRSHLGIIDFYNHWMQSLDWTNGTHPTPSRTQKTIRDDHLTKYSAYPSVLSLLEMDVHQEAAQLADIICALKEEGHINDYHQVALLLHSVRTHISDTYIRAFQERGIPVYCPRARMYFEQEEICLIIGCFASILGYGGTQQDTVMDYSRLPEYIRDCIRYLHNFPTLEQELQAIEDEIAHATEEEGQPGNQLLDYFYRLLFHEVFMSFHTNETQRANLVLFSQYLTTFHNYYRYSCLTPATLPDIRFSLFQTFFCLLYEDGINLPEDPKQPFPLGHIQMMTIHQAKGLEFPVVIAGRLDKPSSPPREEFSNENKYLQRFYHRPPFEAEERISAFDFRRLYYVAFSRAKHLLILTASKKPHKEFAPIWQLAPEHVYAHDDLRAMPAAERKLEDAYPLLKPRYSFTNHIQMYATCPRRFQFFREFNFVPRSSHEPFTGLVVHQTLEHIHRLILEGQFHTLNDEAIQTIFERTYTFLASTSLAPIDASQKENALHQVLNYFHSNQKELGLITETETNFRVEKERYILTGTIDLLLKRNHDLEIMDFKTSKRPEGDAEYLSWYKQQLYLYASALKQTTRQAPKRLFLYWTAEEQKEDALMEIPYTDQQVQEVNAYVDDVVSHIQQQQFAVQAPPKPTICKTCDVRYLCRKEGVI